MPAAPVGGADGDDAPDMKPLVAVARVHLGMDVDLWSCCRLKHCAANDEDRRRDAAAFLASDEVSLRCRDIADIAALLTRKIRMQLSSVRIRKQTPTALAASKREIQTP